MANLNNSQDILDSRDVIARIEELESDEELDEWDTEELRILKELAEEGESVCSDWSFGSTLIRESYFEEYAQELAEDIGAIHRNASWPIYCIDWERAANDLKMDYSSVSFDGVDYYVRS